MTRKVKNTLPLLLLASLLLSCEKENLVPGDALPQWLKTTIEEHESSIRNDSKSIYAVGAWKRTTWNRVYYYEYYNLFFSSMPIAISHSGDTLDTYVGDTDSDYDREKCCGAWVWKGPDFIDLTD
jgi:hypothetical protein